MLHRLLSPRSTVVVGNEDVFSVRPAQVSDCSQSCTQTAKHGLSCLFLMIACSPSCVSVRKGVCFLRTMMENITCRPIRVTSVLYGGTVRSNGMASQFLAIQNGLPLWASQRVTHCMPLWPSQLITHCLPLCASQLVTYCMPFWVSQVVTTVCLSGRATLSSIVCFSGPINLSPIDCPSGLVNLSSIVCLSGPANLSPIVLASLGPPTRHPLFLSLG